MRKVYPNLKIATKYSEIDWNVDVLFIWWWTYALYPVVIAKLKRRKIRTIITGTFNYICPQAPFDYFRRPWYQRILIKSAAMLVDKNVLVSYNEYKQLKSDWHLENVLYCPHGVDTDVYRPLNVVRDSYLFTMALTEHRSIKRKCIIELIDSIRILKKEDPNIKLIVAGHRGDAYEYVKSYIEECQLQDNIKFVGQISLQEKIDYLRHCRVYVQPSKYEGFGLAIAEAMSCGCTVLTTKVGELENVVGDAGIFVEPNPQSIADGIKLALQNNNSYGLKARKRILQLFPMCRREKELHNVIFEEDN